MLVCQLYIYFEEMSVQILCLFFHCYCCLVAKSCPTLCNNIGFLYFGSLSLSFLYILNANFISFMCFSNILGCGLFFHYLNGNFCRSLLFFSVLMSPTYQFYLTWIMLLILYLKNLCLT